MGQLDVVLAHGDGERCDHERVLVLVAREFDGVSSGGGTKDGNRDVRSLPRRDHTLPLARGCVPVSVEP